MTPCDTGPLVALIDENQSRHAACSQAVTTLPGPLITTWPCMAEAMYLLHRELGYAGQDELWQYVEEGALTIHESSPAEVARMRVLMAKYRDRPMDLADASLVAMVEVLGLTHILSIDSDFYLYRLADGSALPVVP